MNMRKLFAAMAVAGAFSGAAVSADTPVVIELYTSQGCSSCPPADAFLHDLAKRDDVIALALHVDYWDYIGWKDSFANPAYSARQHAYAAAADAATVYTPQMVIDGQTHVVGSRTMEVMDAVQAHREQKNAVTVELAKQSDAVDIVASPSEAGDYLVQLVRYVPQQTVDIGRGENAGRVLSYANVVTSWEAIGRWDGQAPLTLRAAAPGDESIVVIIQRGGNGAIVGAAQLR